MPSLKVAFPAGPPLLSFFLVLSLSGGSAFPREPASSASGVSSLSSKAASKLLIHQVKPRYPAVAKINYIQGQVRLQILVNRHGSVARVHILEGQPILAATAFKAVRKWRYRPFKRSNSAEPFRTEVIVNFRVRFRKITDMPFEAEKFLNQQVRPPEIVGRPQKGLQAAQVALKVLVDADGKVLDARPLGTPGAFLKTARRAVRRWKFRPAHWGAVAIPWYVKVKVPISEDLIQRAGRNSTSP